MPILAQENYDSWPVVGGNSENTHYSSLKQINKQNVRSLQIAWTYDSGDSYQGSDMQCNPIVVKGTMFLTTPKLRVVALDAGSGKELWSFTANTDSRSPHPNRGLTYWSNGPQSRILLTVGHELLSLDATNGKLDQSFGDNGRVDMRKAFDRPLEETSLSVTSPGVIYRNLIILGSSVPETLPATAGDIRAYNVVNGKLEWSFHTIPHPGEPGYETWPPNAWKTSGAANNWAGLTIDQKRGLAFIPTGSAAFDFYGADRIGDDLYADSILCLDAATGKRKWHFQGVRHDVWDLDFPSPPLLVTCLHNGKLLEAVAEAGKSGYIYVLDRETGESLFPLTEIKIAPSPMDGERLAQSQRVPTKPLPFVRQTFTSGDVTNRSEAAHAAVLEQLKGLDYGQLFVPPGLRGSVFFPGPAGGAEWGGQAFDPETHMLYVNANELPWIIRLRLSEQISRNLKASRLYQGKCAGCHGANRKGSPPEYPALDHISDRRTTDEVKSVIEKGGGRMPSFASLGASGINGLAAFLHDGTDDQVSVSANAMKGAGPVLKYGLDRFEKFLDPDGYPAVTPPWGTLSAINLDTGECSWKKPLGEFPELVAQGMRDTGSENHGGGIVTAGGLFFIGSTHYDNKFRAFDKATGELLWETKLPFANNATPSMYSLHDKQYIVVPAGGGRERPSGGLFIAFSLP